MREGYNGERKHDLERNERKRGKRRTLKGMIDKWGKEIKGALPSDKNEAN